MSLTGVKMSQEVWLTCLTHALSTETEEIIGLLLGDIQRPENGIATALVWGALPLPRSDRQKDRVETNAEQLDAASIQAERMTVETGTTTRVIGWYHSHPHISVLPSQIDVRTQAMYQLLDSGFIGLIFSCFNEDAQKVGRIRVIAYQSLNGKQGRIIKPLPFIPPQITPTIDIDSSTDSTMVLLGSPKGVNTEQDTGDSKASGDDDFKISWIFPKDTEAVNRLKDAIIDLDTLDMTGDMEEDTHLSALEMSDPEYISKDVPFQVVPSSSLLILESPLSVFANLQRVLYEEEKTAYYQAMTKIRGWDGKVQPLSLVHNTSTYRASLCKMMEYWLIPAMTVLEDRLRENEIQLNSLMEAATQLESEAKSARISSSTSPPHAKSDSSPHAKPDSSPRTAIKIFVSIINSRAQDKKRKL